MSETDWMRPVYYYELLIKYGADPDRVATDINRGHGAHIEATDSTLPELRVAVETADQPEDEA